jgi:glycerol kinase
MDEIQQQWQIENVFTSSMSNEIRNELSNGWKKAVNAAISWTL